MTVATLLDRFSASDRQNPSGTEGPRTVDTPLPETEEIVSKVVVGSALGEAER